jgi:hypothetical protein
MIGSGRTTWVVDLAIQGPITVSRSLKLNAPKGYRYARPYYSDIKLRDVSYGVQASVTTLGRTSNSAHKSATFFVGQMLDVLATHTQLPLFLHYAETPSYRSETHTVQRVIERTEWIEAFREARLLALTEPSFLRALGWFRKGMTTEDPIDSFLAFWNSIEIVASKYHQPSKKTKSGTKNQIWDCFLRLWGPCEEWPIISGDENWIDVNNNVRVQIAHGIAAVDIEQIEVVLYSLETIKAVAHTFLIGWRERQLNPEIPPELDEKFGYE